MLSPIRVFPYALDDYIEIRLKPGSNNITINGHVIETEQPFSDGTNTFVPLRLISEAFGADILWNENGEITIDYNDTTITMTLGSTKCSVNNVEKEMPAAPVLVGDSTMVPVRFIAESYGANVSYNSSTQEALIRLDNDGSLKSLAFLTGESTAQKVGNSHFGWSINVPKGSQVSNSSFNGKNVIITNLERDINIMIRIEGAGSQTLEEYYKEITEKKEYTYGMYESECTLNSNENPPYIEKLYDSSYLGCGLERIYIDRGYRFIVSLYSDKENIPQKLKESAYHVGILNSFDLTYRGNVTGVQDLNKADNNGYVKYECYIPNEDYTPQLIWEINVVPEWEEIDNYGSTYIIGSYGYENLVSTSLGIDENNFMNLTMEKDIYNGNLEEYTLKAKEFYDKNFNPKYYSFKERTLTEVAGIKASELIYSVQHSSSNKKYYIAEYFFVVNNILYHMTLNMLEDTYNTSWDVYRNIINSLKISAKDTTSVTKLIDKNDYNRSKARFAKDDAPAEYKDEEGKWSIAIPGYWTKNETYYYSYLYLNDITRFYYPKAEASIAIEYVENEDNATDKTKKTETAKTNTDTNKQDIESGSVNTDENKSSEKEEIKDKIEDKDKFSLITEFLQEYPYAKKSKNTDERKVTLVKQETIKEKGNEIKLYTYTLEEKNMPCPLNVKFYIIDKAEGSYCFMSQISDMYCSAENEKMMEDIWNSFTILDNEEK